jgi:phage/plasmid-like protein (TIGR03299 family)
VGKGYQILQPVEAFNFCDTLVEAPGGAHYDTAGCLGNGEVIFLSIRMPDADIEVVPGDKQEVSLIFTTSFDGSGASIACISITRPVCQNTLRAALSTNTGMLRVKHTKNQQARFDDAIRLMSGVKQDAATLRDKLTLLAQRKMTRETMTGILDKLFPAPTKDAAKSSFTRRENLLADVLSLYESNDHNAIPAIRGTAYNLLNAVTEWTDHHRDVRLTSGREGYTVERARAENATFGMGHLLKTQALDVILAQTTGAPMHSTITMPVTSAPNLDSGASIGGLLGDIIAGQN